MADEKPAATEEPVEEAPEPTEEELLQQREDAFLERMSARLADEGGALDRWIQRHDQALTNEEKVKGGKADDAKDEAGDGGREPSDAERGRAAGGRRRRRALLPWLY